MPICGNRQMALVEKLGFTRVSGTPEDKKAAGIVMDEIASLGLQGKQEMFSLTGWNVQTARLQVLEPYQKEYVVTGYGRAGSTGPDGVEAEFVYMDSIKALDFLDVKGKIAMASGRRCPADAYRDLIAKGAVGFMTFSGNLWDDPAQTDLDEPALRDLYLQFGQLPGVHLRSADALELVNKGATKVRLTLEQEEFSYEACNVVAELTGTEYPEEILCFTAHYDSVKFSTGAYDNATGVSTLFELLRHYQANPPKRTLRFILCGAEELGLEGSKAYMKAHADELEKLRFVINVDMTGVVLGNDHALVMAEDGANSMLQQLGDEVGFPIQVRQDVASSDCTPFVDKGVPGVSFARYGVEGTGPIHNRHDTMALLSAASLGRTTEFIRLFSDKLVNARHFPLSRTLPKELPGKIDKYFKRDLTPKKEEK